LQQQTIVNNVYDIFCDISTDIENDKKFTKTTCNSFSIALQLLETGGIMTNRKLKRNVSFQGRCYMQYQTIIIEWRMEKHNESETQAMHWYINSGLAEKFEKHHRPRKNKNEITVTEMGQSIG
jgi:hypothetical protein